MERGWKEGSGTKDSNFLERFHSVGKGGEKMVSRNQKRVCSVFLGVFLLAGFIAFCPFPAQGQMDRARSLIVAVAGDLEGWDPATVTYYTANDMIQTLYDRLLEYEIVKTPDGRMLADLTKIKGMLAEKFSVSSDGLTWTFQLRKNVKFSSGNELTSADVKYSFDRALKMNKGILLSMLKFAGVVSTTQTVAEEPYVFKIKLNKPNPVLPHILAQAANSVVLDSKTVEAKVTKEDPFAEKWLRNHVAGSGPYSLEKYEPGNQVIYAANKHYWKGMPKLERVIYKTVPSGPDRVMLLMGGAIDLAYDLTPLDLTTTLKNAPGVKILSFPATSTTVFFTNNKLPPFDNVKVRQALAYAVPYEALIDKVLYGLGKPALSPIAGGVLYHKPVSVVKHDPEKARSLLAEAGLSGGFPMTLTYREGRPEEETSAVFIQAELSKYNIKVTLEKVHTAAWNERRAAKTIAAGIDGYTPYVPDPSYVLEFWYKTGGVLNTWQYSNPRLDELAARSVAELDPAKRKAMIEEAQEMIAKDQPVAWLFHPYWNMAMRDNVEGYVFYPDRFTRHFALYKRY